MSKRKKPAAKAPAGPPAAVPKDKLLELRADSHALYTLLAENGISLLWDMLVDRINDAVDRLSRKTENAGPWLANEAMGLRALVDAVIALETSAAGCRPLTLDQFDTEAQAGKGAAT